MWWGYISSAYLERIVFFFHIWRIIFAGYSIHSSQGSFFPFSILNIFCHSFLTIIGCWYICFAMSTIVCLIWHFDCVVVKVCVCWMKLRFFDLCVFTCPYLWRFGSFSDIILWNMFLMPFPFIHLWNSSNVSICLLNKSCKSHSFVFSF